MSKELFKVLVLIMVMLEGIQADSKTFLTDYVCNAYLPYNKFYKDNENFNYKQFITIEYKYLNKGILSIKHNIEYVDSKHKTQLSLLKKYLARNRKILDEMMMSQFDTSITKISAIHNMLKDDGRGILTDLFKIYILDQREMINLGKKMEYNEKLIKKILFSIIEDVDPKHRLTCN